MQEAIPGYRVTLGFGLHVGWGIEGAIGSMLKVEELGARDEKTSVGGLLRGF